MDDVQNDPNIKKHVKLYKNEKVLDKDLKHMNKEQLDEILGEIEITELLDDLKLDGD